MYVNNEPVYQYTEELWIVDVGQMEYLDLDGDGQEEIFVGFFPAVNSASLEGGWKMLEMPYYEDYMSSNDFPITVVLKKKDFELSILCEGWDGEIAFDATEHYERRKAEVAVGNDAYNAFVDGQYEVESVVGGPLAYGIWEITTGSYHGENCLIALHGIGGPWGRYDYYGNVHVYFNYDETGKIKILHMEFVPTDY